MSSSDKGGGMPKVILTKTIKTKDGWLKAGETVELPKAEAERLAAKGACATLIAEPAKKVEAENK